MDKPVPTIPPYIGKPRAFKARKRRELAALEKAVMNVLCGAAFTPITNVGVVLAEVRSWRERCSARNWGR